VNDNPNEAVPATQGNTVTLPQANILLLNYLPEFLYDFCMQFIVCWVGDVPFLHP